MKFGSHFLSRKKVSVPRKGRPLFEIRDKPKLVKNVCRKELPLNGAKGYPKCLGMKPMKDASLIIMRRDQLQPHID